MKQIYEGVTPFGAGMAFASGLFTIAFEAWTLSVISFGAMAFLVWSYYHRSGVPDDGSQNEVKTE